jgi:nanoRNase/pAp phosphatase (c-di-AMP/oligoRNAs hydrolase)
MGRSAAEKLRRLYRHFATDDHVLVVINADPDAIASAMALKRLLWRKAASVTIASVSAIDRPDNLAMVRLLGVNLRHTDEIDPAAFTRLAIVDSQPDHHVNFQRFAFDVVIDHHPDTNVDAGFLDIRPKYGATASIMTEYLRSARIKPSAKLATGLFFAIKTDTDNFARQALMEDVRAFQFLFRHVNKHLARRIEQAEMRFEYLKYFRRALQDKRVRKDKVFAHLGQVSTPDVCVLLADFFMRVESVNWSIVSGLYDKKLIIIFRNDGLRRHAGKLAQERFGNLGSAGGHKSMSRAEIGVEALRGLTTCSDDAKLAAWIIGRVHRRIRTPASRKAKPDGPDST